MIPAAVRAVFFDAVGTLIFPDPPAATVYAAVGKRYGSQLAAPEIGERFRAAFREQEELDLRHDLQTSEAREEARWRHIVGTVLDDVSDPEACFQELFAHFGRAEAWHCDPEAGHVLTELAGRGYELGLASNYDARLRGVAAGLPELGAVRHLIISSEVGWRKPALGFFEALCRQCGLSATQVLLVGDDWGNDYEGAREAGLHAILLDRSQARVEAEVTRIERFADLVDSAPHS